MSCRCRCHLGGAYPSCDTGTEQPGGALSCSPCDGGRAVPAGQGISPCRYPGCRDGDGNPRLTQRTFCDRCENRYRKLIDWLVLDYVVLKRDMPAPTANPGAGSGHQSQKSKTFGHPAEWASDTAGDIAAWLNWTEDHVRDVSGHEPPPHPGVREISRVRHAYLYLTTPAQFDTLCMFDAAEDVAIEVNDLHRKVRTALGYTRGVQSLPTPCPWCDTAALVRDVGQVECRECGKVVGEKLYPWLTGWIIDQLIEQYDTQRAEKLA